MSRGIWILRWYLISSPFGQHLSTTIKLSDDIKHFGDIAHIFWSATHESLRGSNFWQRAPQPQHPFDAYGDATPPLLSICFHTHLFHSLQQPRFFLTPVNTHARKFVCHPVAYECNCVGCVVIVFKKGDRAHPFFECLSALLDHQAFQNAHSDINWSWVKNSGSPRGNANWLRTIIRRVINGLSGPCRSCHFF